MSIAAFFRIVSKHFWSHKILFKQIVLKLNFDFFYLFKKLLLAAIILSRILHKECLVLAHCYIYLNFEEIFFNKYQKLYYSYLYGIYERVRIDLAYYTAYWPLNRLSYFEEFTLCLYIMDCADIKEKLERIFRLDRWIDRLMDIYPSLSMKSNNYLFS